MYRTLIVGATGAVGGAVTERLVAAGVGQVRALSRNPESARLPLGIEVARGDLTVPESLDACLEGVDAVFLVWTAPPAFVHAVIEGIARTARRIVFLSSPHKTAHPLFQQPNAMRAMHARIEETIIASGLEWTFLRPGMFARNCLGWWAPRIRSREIVRWPYLDVPTAPVDERDIAAVAVDALCKDGHAGAEYVLTGPQSLTQAEQLSTIGHAIGRHIDVEEISRETAQQELASIMPAVVIDMLLAAWAAAKGQPAFVTDTVFQLTGAQPRSFSNWAVEHAHEFIM
jgi:uncharacterized protein YbjT (DUF2867 family)